MLKKAVQNVAQKTVTPRAVHQSGHFWLVVERADSRNVPIVGAERSIVVALIFECPVT
jgi:hypothetical protein